MDMVAPAWSRLTMLLAQFGTTGLMKAVARGHVGVVSVLLSAGRREGEMMLKTKEREPADLHIRSSDGIAPLTVRMCCICLNSVLAQAPLPCILPPTT